MTEISIGGELVFQDFHGQSREILNFYNFYENLSRVSGHAEDDRQQTIPRLIGELSAEYVDLFSEEGGLGQIELMLTLGILSRYCMQRHRPVSILEIGCSGGALSYFLAKTARAFHDDSKVYCLSDLLYNESWIELMGHLGDAMNNLCLLTMNLDSHILQEDFFDFVVINGTEFIHEPETVMQNAVRVTKEGGMILSITKSQYLLESCFKMFIDDYEEYLIDSAEKLLVKYVGAEDKAAVRVYSEQYALDREKAAILSRCQRIGAEIGGACESGFRPEDAIRKLEECENIAIRMLEYGDYSRLKSELNLAKEGALNYLYARDEKHREEALALCRECTAEVRALIG